MPIDYSRYAPNWKTEIVPSVLRRADNCCEECGLLNGSTVYCIKLWIKMGHARYQWRSIWFRHKSDAEREKQRWNDPKEIRVVLTVAHLDHDETNHNVPLERLKAMCQLCHLRYDAAEKYRRSQEKTFNRLKNT